MTGFCAPNIYERVSRTSYNRDLRGLVRLAERLDEAIKAFVEQHSSETVTQELLADGRDPAELTHRDSHRLISDVDCMTDDAIGFQWSLRMFISAAGSGSLTCVDDEPRPDAVVTRGRDA